MPERRSPDRSRSGAGRRGSGGPRRGGSGRSSSARSSAKAADLAPLQPVAEPPDIQSFLEWELGDDVQGAIAAMGITRPTPIQRLAIGPVLAGRDVIAKAETGHGQDARVRRADDGRRSTRRGAACSASCSARRASSPAGGGVLRKLGAAHAA
jgi:hypothetical protein